MKVAGLLKPWYVYRPSQAIRRVARVLRPPRNPVQVTNLPWGCQIEVDIRETIGRSIWTTGLYDLTVAETLYRLADPALLAIDAGANIGALTGLLAARAQEVWAFEPHPQVHVRLESNVGRFSRKPGFVPCRTFSLALADADGEAMLECPEGFAANQGIARLADDGRGTIPVKTARLDRLLEDRSVGLMKLDVEGHELSVLRGAKDALAAGRIRNIVFEDHIGPGSSVCDYLATHGYSIFALGWGMFGLVLRPLGTRVHRAYEAPSYLATTQPTAAVTACRSRGWKSLNGRSR